MGDLLALAVRAEAASGVDRELDCLIEIECGRDGPAIREIMAGSPLNTIHEVARAADREGQALFFRVPAYTASLDAAMTLTEPGWWLDLSAPLSPEAYGYCREEDKLPRAGLQMIGPPYSVGARAATLPLALCAAALRARASTTGGEG